MTMNDRSFRSADQYLEMKVDVSTTKDSLKPEDGRGLVVVQVDTGRGTRITMHVRSTKMGTLRSMNYGYCRRIPLSVAVQNAAGSPASFSTLFAHVLQVKNSPYRPVPS